MKDKNVVDALNRALSDYFGIPCKFYSFSAEIPVEIMSEGMVQGCYESIIVFYAEHPLENKYFVEDTTHLSSGEISTLDGNFVVIKYTALLCLHSKLRKKMLKAMLKHN